MSRERSTRTMMSGVIWAMAGAVMFTGVAMGQHTPAPHGASDTVSPPPSTNHPPTPPTTQGAAAEGVLPAGHPHLDQSPTSMPAGHPGMGGGGLPMGHPGAGEEKAMGALRVLISQGTPGGAAILQDPVNVALYSKGKVLKTYDVKMDAKGVVELKDLPLDEAFQPVVTVTHAGVEQQLVGPSMTKYQPAIEIAMKVYEVTESLPAWSIGMRHVTIETEGVGKVRSLKVTEMIGGFNPLDKAWVGTLNEKKERETLSITLPAGFSDLIMGPGMLEAGAKEEGGKLIRRKAMLPQSTEYWFGYSLPVTDGKATLSFVAPADTTLFAVYLPVGAKVEKAEGVEMGTGPMAKNSSGMQLYKARQVKAGATATIELSNIVFAPKPQTRPMEHGKTEGHP